MFSIYRGAAVSGRAGSDPTAARQLVQAPESAVPSARGRIETRWQGPAGGTCVLLERRDRVFWQQRQALRKRVVPRDPYFAIDLDSGNS